MNESKRAESQKSTARHATGDTEIKIFFFLIGIDQLYRLNTPYG